MQDVLARRPSSAAYKTVLYAGKKTMNKMEGLKGQFSGDSSRLRCSGEHCYIVLIRSIPAVMEQCKKEYDTTPQSIQLLSHLGAFPQLK